MLLLRGKLRLRQVTRLSDNGHQTPILTSRRDLSAGEVAFRMFERWRQENFFKYLREEYALDALVDYEVVPDNPAREVPNPQRAAIDGKLKEAREELSKLQLKYGVEALKNPEWLRPSLRGFKIAQRPLRQSMSAVTNRIASLQSKRSKMPQRVPVENTRDEEIVKLAPEKKHLTNLLKMVAYQAESDLFRLVTPHYKRTEDEGRTLIQNAMSSDADIEVTDLELRVAIAPLSSAHRTKAIAALCEELNRTDTKFPGTHLRLRYRIRETI